MMHCNECGCFASSQRCATETGLCEPSYQEGVACKAAGDCATRNCGIPGKSAASDVPDAGATLDASTQPARDAGSDAGLSDASADAALSDASGNDASSADANLDSGATSVSPEAAAPPSPICLQERGSVCDLARCERCLPDYVGKTGIGGPDVCVGPCNSDTDCPRLTVCASDPTKPEEHAWCRRACSDDSPCSWGGATERCYHVPGAAMRLTGACYKGNPGTEHLFGF